MSSHRSGLQLDIVTMGTPIRYGWDSAGYRHLLHFIHHVPRAGEHLDYLSPLPEWNVAFDATARWRFRTTVWNRRYEHFPLPVRSDLANNRVETRQALAAVWTHQFSEASQNWHAGAGRRNERYWSITTIPSGLARQLAGHAIYTQLEWLAFHATEIASRLYE